MTPSDCALIIALPGDLSVVERAMRGGPYNDYVGRSAMRGSAESLWAAAFFAVAEASARLVRKGKQRGVRVFENGTLEDLETAFASSKVVTVVAHWRGSYIAASDIRAPTPALVELIRNDDGIGGRLRAGLPTGWREAVQSQSSERSRVSRLAEMLNRRMRDRPELMPPPQEGEWYLDEATLRHFNRECLDAWWPEYIKAGNRLELSDGLHSRADIVNAIPEAWSGTVDCSSCQSAQLIDGIKHGRPDRSVIGNIKDTDPISRMAVLEGVYDLIAEAGFGYFEARCTIAHHLTMSERLP